MPLHRLNGKGLYLFELPAGGGKDPQKLAGRLVAAGIEHVYVKIADGGDEWPRSGPDYTAGVVAAAQAAGLTVWGWHYVYGTHPEAEAEVAAKRVTEFGLSGYIYDAEIQYEQTAKKAAARTFVTLIRQSMPSVPFGFSSFKYPTQHSDLPWSVFASAADVLMPQVYWEQAHDPVAQTDRALTEWKALNSAAAIIPTGAAYHVGNWRATPEDVAAFLAHAKAPSCPAVDLWYWDYVAQNANSDLLQAIAGYTWNAAAVPPAAMAAAATAPPAVLTLGEKRPPKAEVQVCGAIVKPILRKDPEFQQLVKNQNPNIVFKDEKKTGADRMMTPKLREKLAVLADAVTREWAGVKLRVTEAWDEDGEHAEGSLHYEGRAADITTDPIDGSKLGRLAQLAVDAGLDWVFFENAVHVHVSVPR